jgi:hypothetical protein
MESRFDESCCCFAGSSYRVGDISGVAGRDEGGLVEREELQLGQTEFEEADDEKALLAIMISSESVRRIAGAGREATKSMGRRISTVVPVTKLSSM